MGEDGIQNFFGEQHVFRPFCLQPVPVFNLCVPLRLLKVHARAQTRRADATSLAVNRQPPMQPLLPESWSG